MRVVCILLALATVPAGAHASDFWESILWPGLTRYRTSITSGKGHLERNEYGPALVHFERAVAAMPNRSEGHLLRGTALYRLERWQGAIDAWTRARGLDRLLAYDVLLTFEFGLALTHLGRLDEAIDEYQRLLSSTGPAHRLRPIALANCAELLMVSGPEHLDEAIAYYRSAVEVGGGYVLGQWGLALALDRAGRGAESSTVLDQLRRTDRGMRELSSHDVFFVPAYDEHAYRALGLEAFGNLQAAANAWQSFLEQGGGAGPWGDPARRHLRSVQERIDRAPARAPRRPRPLALPRRPRRPGAPPTTTPSP